MMSTNLPPIYRLAPPNSPPPFTKEEEERISNILFSPFLTNPILTNLLYSLDATDEMKADPNYSSDLYLRTSEKIYKQIMILAKNVLFENISRPIDHFGSKFLSKYHIVFKKEYEGRYVGLIIQKDEPPIGIGSTFYAQRAYFVKFPFDEEFQELFVDPKIKPIAIKCIKQLENPTWTPSERKWLIDRTIDNVKRHYQLFLSMALDPDFLITQPPEIYESLDSKETETIFLVQKPYFGVTETPDENLPLEPLTEAIPSLGTNLGLDFESLLRKLKDAFRTIAKIHKTGQVHLNIKPNSFYLDTDYKLRVGDLDLLQKIRISTYELFSNEEKNYIYFDDSMRNNLVHPNTDIWAFLLSMLHLFGTNATIKTHAEYNGYFADREVVLRDAKEHACKYLERLFSRICPEEHSQALNSRYKEFGLKELMKLKETTLTKEQKSRLLRMHKDYEVIISIFMVVQQAFQKNKSTWKYFNNRYGAALQEIKERYVYSLPPGAPHPDIILNEVYQKELTDQFYSSDQVLRWLDSLIEKYTPATVSKNRGH